MKTTTITPLAAFLAQGRHERKLSLREACERVTTKGGQISHSTLLRIEQGKLQPSAMDLMRLAAAYDLSEDAVLDAVEAERRGVRPASGTLAEIIKQGEEHWRRGEISEAFACVLALRGVEAFGEDQVRLLQRACLDFATYARGVGWLRLARGLLDEVLKAPATEELAAQSLVLAASLSRISGMPLVAEAMIEHAARVAPRDNVITRAMIEHQRAKLLAESGRFPLASKHLASALRLYRRAGQHTNAMRAEILNIAVLEGLGRTSAALTAASRAVRGAVARGMRQLESNARMERGRLLCACGRAGEGIRELRQALGLATLIEDANTEFHVQYRLWKAYERLGDAASADLALQTARLLLGKIDPNGPEAVDIKRRDSAARGGP